MALTATFQGNSRSRACWLLDQDGAAGTTVTINNAALQAALPVGTHIGNLVRRAAADAAAARMLLLGQAVDTPPQAGNAARLVGRVTVVGRTGAASAVMVDASAAANLAQLDLVAPAAAATWLLFIDVLDPV